MSDKTALLVVDAQVDMFDPSCPVIGAAPLLERLTQLVARSRASRIPVVFVRNTGGVGDPDEPGTPGWEIHPALRPAPGELVIDKTTGDAFANTPLQNELTSRGVKHVIIAGLQSEYCIRDTTLGALSRGYEVTLVSDGHGTYDAKGQPAQGKCDAVNAEFQGRVTLLSAAQVRFK